MNALISSQPVTVATYLQATTLGSLVKFHGYPVILETF